MFLRTLLLLLLLSSSVACQVKSALPDPPETMVEGKLIKIHRSHSVTYYVDLEYNLCFAKLTYHSFHKLGSCPPKLLAKAKSTYEKAQKNTTGEDK